MSGVMRLCLGGAKDRSTGTTLAWSIPPIPARPATLPGSNREKARCGGRDRVLPFRRQRPRLVILAPTVPMLN